jgi:predicted house-cleaning noncanonical NTP pyrophosphatase (MazG superfamily)
MREAADKVVAGLDKVSEEIFGDMQEEKEAARAMLADAIGLYANDAQLFVSLENRTPSEASKALHGHEREEFAKILEILGRLRLAREFSEKDTVESLKKEMILESSVKQNRERDVLETLTSDIAKQASSEQFKTTFESTLTELMRRATRATDEKETEKVVKQLRTYGTMHDALYPKSKAPVEDLVPIKQTVKEEPLREPKDVEKTPPKPRRGRTATRRMT